MELIDCDDDLELYIVATGMHLCAEFGLTYREIEEDGFKINKKIEMLLTSDTDSGMSKSIGVGILGFSDYFEEPRPDLVVVLGDRYEILSAALAALCFKIPIAHIHGGETTQGAIDEAIRHAVTKMSHIHFTSTEEYRKRVIQLGENPGNVFNVGAPGVENINSLELMEKAQLESSLGIELKKPYMLVTFHSVTLETGSAENELNELFSALEEFSGTYDFIFTKANSDAGGRIINRMLDEYTKDRNGFHCFTSLGYLRYLSAMRYCSAVVGNSSSGIIEAPSMHVPTVNIGDRQAGRVRASTVIDCWPNKAEIESAVAKAVSKHFKEACLSARTHITGKEPRAPF
jgi:GDP/UDP-N,N'-diacetylbacillosamine 2-epimerase (hydrolysing)